MYSLARSFLQHKLYADASLSSIRRTWNKKSLVGSRRFEIDGFLFLSGDRSWRVVWKSIASLSDFTAVSPYLSLLFFSSFYFWSEFWNLFGVFRNGQTELSTLVCLMPIASVDFLQVPLSFSVGGIKFGFPQWGLVEKLQLLLK